MVRHGGRRWLRRLDSRAPASEIRLSPQGYGARCGGRCVSGRSTVRWAVSPEPPRERPSARPRAPARYRDGGRDDHRGLDLRAALGGHRPRSESRWRDGGVGRGGLPHVARGLGNRRVVGPDTGMRRGLRLPARGLLATARLPLGLGHVLDDAHGDHRRDRRRVGALRGLLSAARRRRHTSHGCGGRGAAHRGELRRRAPRRRPAGDLHGREGRSHPVDHRRGLCPRTPVRGAVGDGRRAGGGLRIARRLHARRCRGAVCLRWLAHGHLQRRGDHRSPSHDPTRAASRRADRDRLLHRAQRRLLLRAARGVGDLLESCRGRRRRSGARRGRRGDPLVAGRVLHFRRAHRHRAGRAACLLRHGP